MDPFNSFSQNSPPYSYGAMAPYSNIILVTSLDEAIMRTTRPNSDIVYFNQNGSEFYRVKMEANGAKYHQTFPYNMPDVNATPVTRSDLEPIMARLSELEKSLNKEASNV